MGNCIVSCLKAKNAATVVANPEITAALTVKQYTIEVTDSEHPETETKIRRSLSSADMTMDDMTHTYYRAGGKYSSVVDMICEQAKHNPTRRALAFRPVDHTEKGVLEDDHGNMKPWTFIHFKATEYLTYGNWWNTVMAFGRGLRALGCHSGDRMGLYEETRWEWLTAADGAWTQSIVPVTVYANLGEDALVFAIRQAELHYMFCNGSSVSRIQALCSQAGVKVPFLIYTDTLSPSLDADFIRDYTKPFTEVVDQGRASSEVLRCPQSPDDLALIMYTSGTTGEPKGVMISHGNFMSCVLGWQRVLLPDSATSNQKKEEAEQDVFVAYLPLAHILEFIAEHIMLVRGALVGYSNPKTLTNTSARPHGDLQEFQPAFFVGVPRIYETIKKAIEARLPPSGTIKRKIFDTAYRERVEAIAQGKDTPYWNEKVFASTQKLLGGKLRCAFTGGAPISGKTQEFLQVVLGCSLCQGYALTEMSCGTTQRLWQTQNLDNCGGLISNVELKLRDVEGYSHTDGLPTGEVCLRGPAVTKGYYKQPELTATAFSEDGWFYTGDVGQIQPDGSLKLIGRVKSLAKNSLGEYIAVEALECTYVGDSLAMPNGVCVVVHPQRSYIGALVLTDEIKAMNFAKKHNMEKVSWPSVLSDERFQALAAQSLAATAKAHGRRPFELVRKVRVLSDEWTPENGVLTAAMKLKRRVISEKYKTIIDELFCDGD